MTIVIPTRDRHELAKRAIESAMAQTHRPLEVIVVDDGSTPPFELSSAGGEVTLLRNDTARGPSVARNQAIERARGEWITFLDDDDVIAPKMVEMSLAGAAQSDLPGPVSVLSGAAITTPEGTVLKTRVPPTLVKGQHFFLEDLEEKGSFQTHATLVTPTQLVRDIGGFDEDLRGSEHDDFFLRLNAASSIQGIAEVTYTITAHEGPRLSKAVVERAEGMWRTVEKHEATFAQHPRRYAAYVTSMGVTFLRAGRWGQAVKATSKAIRIDPTRPRVYLWFLASLAGPQALAAIRWLRRRVRKG